MLALQLGFVPLALAVKAVGAVMVVLPLMVQELASVIVTVYVPAPKLLTLVVVAPPFHAYVYGEVPPPGVAVTLPSVLPLQLGFVPVTDKVSAVGWLNVTLAEKEQDFASVTVTVYVPAGWADIVEITAPVLQT